MTKSCPKCRQTIVQTDAVCRYCQHRLLPIEIGNPQKTKKSHTNPILGDAGKFDLLK